jgi:hypothetical protein
MDTRELIERVQESTVLALDPGRLPGLLEASETLRAEDTRLSGWIRILRLEGNLVIQEETPNGEVLLRDAATRDAADQFVDKRLADYERMWDGCGCRIDYRG